MIKESLCFEELTKKLDYGIGGIHFSSTTIASFQDVEELNSLLQLKEICKIERYVKFLDSEIRLTIKPNVYFDYSITGDGINYKKYITNYDNTKTKDLDSNIFHIDVDGLFCPRVDFTKNINKNKMILNKSSSLSKSGKMIFPKHFGFGGLYIIKN